jgi:hypothetical protein
VAIIGLAEALAAGATDMQTNRSIESYVIISALSIAFLASCSSKMAPIPLSTPESASVGTAQKPGMDPMSACQAEANRAWGVSNSVATNPLPAESGGRKSVVQATGHKGTCTLDANGTPHIANG